MIGTVLLLLASAAVAVAAVEAAALLPGLRPRERIVAAFTFFPAGIVALTVVVGLVLRLYRPLPMLLAALLLAGGLQLLARRSAERWECTADAMADMLFATVDTVKEAAGSWVARVLGVVSGILVGLRVVLALRMPIADYDGLYYHLLAPATWVQQGAVVHAPPLPVYADVYPPNGEVVMGWLTLFRHDVGLADLAQVPFALLGAVALAAAARQLQLSRAWSVCVGLLFLITPIVVAQLNTAYVDVMAVAPLFVAFGALAAAVVAGRRDAGFVSRLVLAGTGLGLAVGTKTSNLIFLLPALVLLVWLYLAPVVKASGDRNPQRVDLRGGLLGLLGFGLPLLLLAGVWFLRTWVEYGNPLHPFDVAIGPLHVADGTTTVPQIIDNQMPAELATERGAARAVESWLAEPEDFYGYDQRLGGLGLTFTYLMVPALLLGARAMWARSRTFVLAFVLPLTLVLLYQPAIWWSRYTLWLVGPGAIALVFFASICRTRGGRTLVTVTIVGAVLLSGWLSLATTSLDGERAPLGDTLSVAFGAGPEHGPGETIFEAPFAGVRSLPDGAVVGVVEDTMSHPFVVVGQDLERQMVSVGAPAQLDLDGVEERLTAVGATHLYVPPATVEGTVAAQHPDRFQELAPVDVAGFVAYEWLPAAG